MMLDASDLPSLLPAQKQLRDVAAWFRETGTDFEFAVNLKTMLRQTADDELWDVLSDSKLEKLMGILGDSSIRMNPETGKKARGFYGKTAMQLWDALEASFSAGSEAEEEEPSLFDDIEDDPAATRGTHVTPRHAVEEAA